MVTSNVVNEYREQYETKKDDVITSEGKFKDEHISIPYFWDCIENGDSENVSVGNVTISFLVIGDSEREMFLDLKDYYGLALYETEQGYVNSIWFDSRREFTEAMDNPDEII